MFLLLLAYFGGVLTILSPCILPVLPVRLCTRAISPFARAACRCWLVMVQSPSRLSQAWRPSAVAGQFARTSLAASPLWFCLESLA